MPQVGVKFMSADKISHYMMSAMFLSRANAAVRKAVDRLKAKGIEPAYVIRCPEDAAQEVSGQVLKVSVSQSSIKPNHSKLHDAVCQRKRHTGSHYFRRAKRLRKIHDH